MLGPAYGGIDATAGMIMFSDGSVYHLNISWALPVTWPGAVYSLEVGITGTDGVLTIDDTHRDMVLAVSKPQGEGYAPDQTRLVDFLNVPEGALVKPKDPLEYVRKLRFQQGVASLSDYGVTPAGCVA